MEDKFTDNSNGKGIIITTNEGITYDASDAAGHRRAQEARAQAARKAAEKKNRP